MFIRVKKNGRHEYLQLVSSERIEGKVRQRVIGTLGRRDLVEQSGALGGLAASLNKFLRRAVVLACGATARCATRRRSRSGIRIYGWSRRSSGPRSRRC